MKKVLVLNFFPAFTPPASGGELRYFNIYNRLSEKYDISLLSPTYPNHKLEIIEHSNTFREYRIPKESIHTQLHMEIGAKNIGSEISALVCALSANYPNKYHVFYNKLYQDSDIIIHDGPFMLGYDLFFESDNKLRIYNSYNLEYSLAKQLWHGPSSKEYINYIFDLESKLVKGADLILVTSLEEQREFMDTFDIPKEKIKFAPNGINPTNLARGELVNKGVKKAFFIGSSHPPNIEAVEFIMNTLAMNCPDIEFLIAGNCCEKFCNITLPNIKLLGKVDDKTKTELFNEVDVAINPMFSGAGTNLKTLEFLSSGIPLISTGVGVRGLQLINGQHFILADKENFAEKLQTFCQGDLTDFMTANGREYINASYSWSNIANNIKEFIDELDTKNNKRKKLLVLNDFEVSEPVSGGEVRINKLYSELSRYYDIILICLNNHMQIRKTNITPNFVEISFPKTHEHQVEETKVNSKFVVSASDIVNSYMCVNNLTLTKTFSEAYVISDVIIASHPYMINLLQELGDKQIKKPIIYESLNCEVDLKKQMLKGHPKYLGLLSQVKDVETKACKQAEFIISVSDDDHRLLADLMIDQPKNIFTIKNGVEIKNAEYFEQAYLSIKKEFQDHPIVLFIGSAHQPNVQAAEFIINLLAPSLPDCYFIIIGSVCAALHKQVNNNVLPFGKLDERYKDILLRISDIAINPMLEGSGSNLKLAEYFACRLPTVTTKVGARGYDIEDGKHALICNLAEFKSQIELILNDQDLNQCLKQNAYNYVLQELDWKVLARKYMEIIESQPHQKKKLLVITYRFTDPPLGGAETFLLNVLKEIRKLDQFSIDVATLDIYDIHNKYHFGTNYSSNEKKDIFNDNIKALIFKADILPDKTMYTYSMELYKLWMKESLQISLKWLDKYDYPLLLGGWYYPERAEVNYEIWSSQESLIYLKNIRHVTIEGYSSKMTKLYILVDGKMLFKKHIIGNFKIDLDLENNVVLKLKVKPFSVKSDPRLLGVKIKSIIYQTGNDVNSLLKLNYDYKSFMKEYFYKEYIEELIKNATSRPKEYDEMFQSVRGPKSRQLETWLDKNSSNYDIIMGHSVPFNTINIASSYGGKYNKPVVALPHFHIDDEFYHWNSYYESMKKADAVIVSPKAALGLFFDKIKVKSHFMIGGAMYKEEYENIDSCKFLELYASELPFIFVLGRKAQAKNYKWVIEAINEINSQQAICNLVIIGKDEDGEKLEDNEALFYLGEQSREVVLGALKECTCLINMSESESFGIVILEAWMQKKPVIVNEKCTAFMELVENDLNGLAANRENLAEKITFVLQHNNISALMGEVGYKKASASYTWESLGAEVNRLFLNLIK